MRILDFAVVAAVALAAGSAGAAEIVVSSAAGGGRVATYSTPDPTLLRSFDAATVGASVGAYNDDGVVHLVVGAGGRGQEVKLFDPVHGTVTLNPFEEAYAGGVNVALGDLNGDGRADIVVGAAGASRVNVFDGRTLMSIKAFNPFEDDASAGGVRVAVGDLNGDGLADLIVGAQTGGSHVRVFDGLSSTWLHNFDAFDRDFTGGVSVGLGRLGDLNTLIVGQARGGSEVKIFDPTNPNPVLDFFAFDGSDDGVSVAGGSYGGLDSVILGSQGEARVQVYQTFLRRDAGLSLRGDTGPTLLADFAPAGFEGGVNVAGVFASAPEPAAWALMLGGFGLLGGALRRRRALCGTADAA